MNQQQMALNLSSSAFPDNKNPKKQSKVHDLLKQHLDQYPIPQVQIREYQPSDLQQLKKLQLEWFPLNYSNDFYQRIIHKTAVCFIAQAQVNTATSQIPVKVLVGAVVFEIGQENDELKDSFLNRIFTSQDKSIYIMTLGVIDEFRSTGLAKKLLNQVVIFARDKPSIGIIFLHVVSYNRRAIKFYKNNGFSLLQYLTEHYHIMGQQYDAFKLGLFLNEGRRRQKWLPWFKRVFLRKETIDEWPV